MKIAVFECFVNHAKDTRLQHEACSIGGCGRLQYTGRMPVKKGMFQGERREKDRKIRTSSIILVIAFVVVAALWFVFQSGYFDADDIHIEGLRSLEEGDVRREVGEALEAQSKWRPWNSTNVLFMDEAALQERLKERLFAENVIVDKSYPNILRLKVEERQRSVILVSNQNYVLVDTSGVVTGFADGNVLSLAQDRIAVRTLASPDSLPVVQLRTDDPLVPGFQIADAETVQTWIEISRILISRGIDTHFLKIDAPYSSVLRFVMERRYELRLDREKAFEPQIETYETFLQTTGDDEVREYVDVRVPGKIFYK